MIDFNSSLSRIRNFLTHIILSMSSARESEVHGGDTNIDIIDMRNLRIQSNPYNLTSNF